MQDRGYLAFDRYGIRRFTKGPPSLKAGEYAVRIHLEVPDAQFERAIPEAHLLIPPTALIAPRVEVVSNRPAVEWSEEPEAPENPADDSNTPLAI